MSDSVHKIFFSHLNEISCKLSNSAHSVNKLLSTDLSIYNLSTCCRCDCPPNWHGIRCTETHDDCTGASTQALCGHGTCVNVDREQAGQV